TPNTTALAPIPSASVKIAVTANPGDFLNCRNASLTLLVILAILIQNYDCAGHIVPHESRTVSVLVTLLHAPRVALHSKKSVGPLKWIQSNYLTAGFDDMQRRDT